MGDFKEMPDNFLQCSSQIGAPCRSHGDPAFGNGLDERSCSPAECCMQEKIFLEMPTPGRDLGFIGLE